MTTYLKINGDRIVGLDGLVGQIQTGAERIFVEVGGKPAFAIIDLESLATLEQAEEEDRLDGEAASEALRRIKSGESTLIPWEEVQAELERKRCWQPAELHFLQREILMALAAADDKSRTFYGEVAMKPAKWVLSPWGDEGHGFWAFAVHEGQVLWYNDIEEGFNIARFEIAGEIPASEYWCNQDGFDYALRKLRVGYVGPKVEPPEPPDQSLINTPT